MKIILDSCKSPPTGLVCVLVINTVLSKVNVKKMLKCSSSLTVSKHPRVLQIEIEDTVQMAETKNSITHI